MADNSSEIVLDKLILYANITLEKIQKKCDADEFVQILGMRVIDGAETCSSLLKIGRITFLPVIMRSVIEAVANILYLKKDEYKLKDVINFNNRKMIKDIEAIISISIDNKDHVELLVEKIERARIENKTGDNTFDLKISEIIKMLDNKQMQILYSMYARESHNDLNEMVRTYVIKDGESYIIRIPYNDIIRRENYASALSFILFSFISYVHLCYKIVSDDDYKNMVTIIKAHFPQPS